MRGARLTLRLTVAALLLGLMPPLGYAQDAPNVTPELERFRRDIKPLLETYCYDCHGNGASEGNKAFDSLEAHGELLNNPKLWSLMLQNVRAGVMPPEGSPRPSAEEFKRISEWAKRDVFHVDPAHPDPGRVVLRRHNRVEYQNTIRDLLGYDYDVVLHFPPDDTGYGFDTIGDVLTVSPMLTEKYLEAAESIVDAVVPKVSRQPAEKVFRGREFIDAITAAQEEPEERDRANRGWPHSGQEIHFDEAADLNAAYKAAVAGKYEIELELRVDGQFEYNPLRSQVRFLLDGEELINRIFVNHDGESYFYKFAKDWDAGEHPLKFDITPLPPAEDAPPGREDVFVRFKVISVKVKGPTAREHWVKPPNFDRLFTREYPPESDEERFAYASEVLRKFATRAFRRPVDDATVKALTQIAAGEYQKPDKTFEQGIGRAMVAILASPRFLYRIEQSLSTAEGEPYPLLDEYSLASRLSYFLWSTMPDDKLFHLAGEGKLRAQLDQQIDRMLTDKRSQAFIENFAGQWLRARDVAHIRIDANAVALADLPPEEAAALVAQSGFGRGRGNRNRANQDRNAANQDATNQNAANQEAANQETAAREIINREAENRLANNERRNRDDNNREANNQEANNQEAANNNNEDRPAEANRGRRGRGEQGRGRGRGRGRGGRGRGRAEFDGELRRAMQQETEMQFAHIMRSDRSLLELLSANYAFLNQRLAQHYGIPGVMGNEMRLVELPPGSPRGGVLTQGTLLTITSNPDRTSPVKRGFYILDNILGTPPPPPPPNVPELEASADKFAGKTPTLREVLEAHRDSPMCSACHSRMDPLGLALENFNAMGAWRTAEKGVAINATGRLVSGEEFDGIKALKTILVENKKRDFYRCATEKLMTYALGRGVEFTDMHNVDLIVDELDRQEGKFSVMLKGIIKSPQFQRRREVEPAAVAAKEEQ
jgi:hypothetical protein